MLHVCADEWTDELLPAGTRVAAGRYRRVDVPFGPTITLEEEDRLPASLDGQVALYLPVAEHPFALKAQALGGAA